MTTPRVHTDAVDGLTVADVMHADFTTVPPGATVGSVRAWFQGSASRRLALIADAGRYVGSLTRAEVEDDSTPMRTVDEIARIGSTVSPEAAAAFGRDIVLQTEARRVAVVDLDGRLVGVLALTSDEQFFSCAAAG